MNVKVNGEWYVESDYWTRLSLTGSLALKMSRSPGQPVHAQPWVSNLPGYANS